MSNTRYEEANGGGSSSFMLGAICGAAAGAAFALLFAPKAGTELRRQLAGSADEWRRKASEAYGEASDKVSSAIDQGKNVVNDAIKSGKGMVDQAVDQGKEAIDRGKAAYKSTVADQTSSSGSGSLSNPTRPHGVT